MAVKIASVSTKGGTGKTSLVKNLAMVEAEKGMRVLIIDLCQNSDVAVRLGYERNDIQFDTYDWVAGEATFDQVKVSDDETGIDFIPASNQVEKIVEYANKKFTIGQEFILQKMIETIEDRYDYIFIDTHPTETNRMLVYSLVAADLALMPTLLDLSSIVATIRTFDYIKSIKEQVPLDYAVVPMAVDFSKGYGKELKEVIEQFKGLGIENFTSAIRFSAAVNRAGLNQHVLAHQKNKYASNVMDDYRMVAGELHRFNPVEQ